MRKSVLAAAAAAVAVVTLAACGTSSTQTSDKSSAPGSASAGQQERTTTLTVGLVPVVNVAPLYLGIKQGFFKAEGLAIKPVISQTFTANVAAVVNGTQQIGFGATVPLLLSVNNGVPLRILANSDVTGKPPNGDNSGVFVANGSGITSVKGLEGKTIAINALDNVQDTAIKSAMLNAGADPSRVKFLEVPLPAMVATLKAHRVDAIALGEPFVTAAEAAGFTMLIRTYEAGFPIGTPIASYFSSQSWAQKNPKLAAAFSAAMDKSTAYAIANPDAARAIMSEYTQIPSETLKKVILGTFSSKAEPGPIEDLAKLMVKVGTMKSVPDLTPVFGQ
jgi:NitT/TauT family transport system substrate-binding protein